VLALLLRPLAAAAQQRPGAVELGAAGLGAFARETFVGGALGLGWRRGTLGRAAATVAGGTLDGAAAARLEVSVQFLAGAPGRTGPTPYGGLGAAYVMARGAGACGYVLLLLGVERLSAGGPAAPGGPGGRRVGWFVEAGVGGGTRVAAGLRARWTARGAPP
jgi:hypothetical protein